MERHEWRERQAEKLVNRLAYGLVRDLDDLYESLCDLDRWGLIAEEREAAGLFLTESDRDEYGRPDLIPTFGGDDTPWIGGGAISWDETRMLVGGPGSWEIVPRGCGWRD